MNTYELMKKALAAGVVAVSIGLAGCHADGDNTVGPGNGVGGGGSSDGTGNCVVPLGEVCVSGGSGSTNALLDDALAAGGPLASLAGPLSGVTDELQTAIQNLLENDGDLASLVTNLLQGTDGKEPNLQLALAALLDGGLEDILTDLLSAQTLQNLLGEEGVTGVVKGLLQSSGDDKCQAAVSTVCLIGGDGGKTGLVDALITENGALADLAANLALDDLVGTLGDLLESDGTIGDLVSGLLQEGQLMAALEKLLDPNQEGSLADTLGDLLLGQGRDQNLVQQLLNGLGNLVGKVVGG